jgi:hypothetical protein
VVHDQSLPAQGHVDPAISIADARSCDLPDAVPEERLVVTVGSIAVARPIKPQDRTAAALADRYRSCR